MCSGKNICILAAFIGLVLAKPAIRTETNPKLTGGYVEGDMVLDTELRNGLRSPVYRWPNKTVYYKFVTEFDEPHKNYILRGMQILQSVSCVRFKEATAETKAFINITGFGVDCYAEVGYKNTPGQTYNIAIGDLDFGCFSLGSIVHEFLHTFGFYHMQSAAERDDYIRIIKENVKPGYVHNFIKYDKGVVDNYDEEYDYGSLMHYPSDAFSVNGGLTIIPLKWTAGSVMGQRVGMSQKDINKLNVMYRCPLHV